MSGPEYLPFLRKRKLRKRKDDRYEAVSGQMDADFFVRALFEPGLLR